MKVSHQVVNPVNLRVREEEGRQVPPGEEHHREDLVDRKARLGRGLNREEAVNHQLDSAKMISMAVKVQ